MRRLRMTAALLAVLLLTGLLPVATVLAAESSSVDLSGPATIEVGEDATLTATVTAGAGYETDATISFTETGGGDGCADVPVDTSGTTCLLSGLAVGTYTYQATYSGNTEFDGSSTTVDFVLEVAAVPPPPPPDPSPSTTTLTGPGSILTGTGATITATVDAPAGYDGDGATIDFTAVSGSGPECLGVAVSTAGTVCDLSVLSIGTYVYEANYSGNSTTEGSTSNQVTITVTAEPDTTLDADSVTRDYTTFYPAKDSYKDKLTMSGNRNEPISVTIKIYASSGKKVKTKTIGLGSGPYSYAWSGRTSSGKLLKSGKYKIVQTLIDPSGNKLVVTQSSTLSHKKLVTRTKYVTKKGLSITAGSSGNIWISKSAGYAKLKGDPGYPAVAGYSFTIPGATRYKSLSFQIYAKGPSSSPKSVIGMQNWTWGDPCDDPGDGWWIDCFDQVESWSSGSAKWHSTSGSASANRRGTRVRGIIASNHGTVVVYKVRVKVVYQVLR